MLLLATATYALILACICKRKGGFCQPSHLDLGRRAGGPKGAGAHPITMTTNTSVFLTNTHSRLAIIALESVRRGISAPTVFDTEEK